MTTLRERHRRPEISGLDDVQRIDIGCGAPHERYEGCFGIDLNEGYVPDLVWDCDLGLPFSDGSLSFINSDNSLEHFHHPYFVLEECYRCLRDGGLLRVAVPNVQYFPTLVLSFFCDVDRYSHFYMRLPHKRERTIHQTLFTKHTIQRMSSEVGFVVRRTKGFLYSKEVVLELEKSTETLAS